MSKKRHQKKLQQREKNILLQHNTPKYPAAQKEANAWPERQKNEEVAPRKTCKKQKNKKVSILAKKKAKMRCAKPLQQIWQAGNCG